jgi:sec-independent protein translocase protein TatA
MLTYQTTSLAAIGAPGPLELTIILGAMLLIFGPKKLPALAKAIGHSINEFKDAMSGKTRYVEDETDEEPKQIESEKKNDD